MENCSLFRRFGAIIYDTLLLFCVVFIAWQPMPFVTDLLSYLSHSSLYYFPYDFLGNALKLGYLLGICFLFFAWFWRNGGQTLGMRAWKIKLILSHESGEGGATDSIPWGLCWLRFISAMGSWSLLGLGFLFSLVHSNKLTWHDIFSRTKLIVIRQ